MRNTLVIRVALLDLESGQHRTIDEEHFTSPSANREAFRTGHPSFS